MTPSPCWVAEARWRSRQVLLSWVSKTLLNRLCHVRLCGVLRFMVTVVSIAHSKLQRSCLHGLQSSSCSLSLFHHMVSLDGIWSSEACTLSLSIGSKFIAGGAQTPEKGGDTPNDGPCQCHCTSATLPGSTGIRKSSRLGDGPWGWAWNPQALNSS